MSYRYNVTVHSNTTTTGSIRFTNNDYQYTYASAPTYYHTVAVTAEKAPATNKQAKHLLSNEEEER